MSLIVALQRAQAVACAALANHHCISPLLASPRRHFAPLCTHTIPVAAAVHRAGPSTPSPAPCWIRGQWVVGLTYEYTSFNSISDTALAFYAGQHEHVHTLRTIQSPAISLSYGLTSDLTISARLPYVLRTDISEGAHSHVHGGAALNEVVHRGDSEGHWRCLVPGSVPDRQQSRDGNGLVVAGRRQSPHRPHRCQRQER